MFIGDNSTCDHLIHEALDNALDEVQNGYGDIAGISFSKSGAILVFDNGRGLPCGETYDEDSGKKVDTVELIFTKLHSGTKFSLEDDLSSQSTGQNGVGNTCINALSEVVDVKTRSKDKIWHYVFRNGELSKKEEISEMKHSTEIIFKPDPQYFGSVVPNYKLFYHRLRLAQAKIPEAEFWFNGKKLEKESLEDFARKQLNIDNDTPLFNASYGTRIVFKERGKKPVKRPANITVFMTYEPGDMIVAGDVNLRFTEGTYLNNLQNLIKKILPGKLDKKFQKAPERFLLEGLRLYASLQYPLPGFDSQTKTRLVTNVKSDVIDPLEQSISKILGEKHIKSVVEEILSQKLSTTAAKKVKKNRISADNKLRDCINHGDGTTLYIVEGDQKLSRLNMNETIRITYRNDNNLSFFTDHIDEMAEKYSSAESVLRDCRDTHNEANLPLKIHVVA